MSIDELLCQCDLCVATPQRLAPSTPFSCSNEDLDDFFLQDATLYQKRLLGKTYLFCLKSNPSIIVSAFTLSNDSIRITIRYYLKNQFHFLIEDERLEAKYMGIGINRLPLHTRLMYFDLLDIQVDDDYNS